MQSLLRHAVVRGGRFPRRHDVRIRQERSHDGGERDGKRGPDDAVDHRARGDGDEHGRRMEPDRAPHDDRRQDLALDLLDDHHRGQDEQGVVEATGDERDERRRRTGDVARRSARTPSRTSERREAARPALE